MSSNQYTQNNSRPDYDMLEDEMNPPPRPFTPQDPDPAASPCTRVCTLDENNVCIGCARSLTEITRWSTMTDAERRVVVSETVDRFSRR